jgi:hypothetical protein
MLKKMSICASHRRLRFDVAGRRVVVALQMWWSRVLQL